jgi:hypothetical protein
MRRIFAPLIAIGFCASASTMYAAVLITLDETYSEVKGSGNNNPVVLFYTGGTVATATLPGYSSVTTSSFGQALFSSTFDHSRGGARYGYATSAVQVDFTLDANVSYAATGNYSSTGGYIDFFSYLYDTTSNSYLYYSQQDSSAAPASFVLGGTAGNYYNDFEGNLSGTLLAGHSYEWAGRAYTQADPNADGGATGSGGTSLTFGPAAVPEISSAIIWSLLALTIGGAGWWKRSQMVA